MLETAQRGDLVLTVIDSEVVPCRFIKFDNDNGVIMTYVEQDKWGKHQRTSDRYLVFPKTQGAAAKKLAMSEDQRPERVDPPIRTSYSGDELRVGDQIVAYDKDQTIYKVTSISFPILTLVDSNGTKVEHNCASSPNGQFRLKNR